MIIRRCLVLLLLLSLLSGCQLETLIYKTPLLGEIYRLPDLDQCCTRMAGVNLVLNHRSLLTHNALIPLAVAWLLRRGGGLGLALSLLVGTLFALHFGFDLFPQKWYGHAWIHIPLLGWLDWIPLDNNWIPTAFSITWLSVNLLLSQGAFLLVLLTRQRA